MTFILCDDPRRRYQLPWIVFSALVTVNMVRVFKNGFGTLVFMFYFFVPLALCYFANLKFLFSPPPGRVPPVLDADGINIEHDEDLYGYEEPHAESVEYDHGYEGYSGDEHAHGIAGSSH